MNCPICEKNLLPVISGSNSVNIIYKCPECGLKHLEPMQRDFNTHYMYNNHQYSTDKAFWAQRSVKKYLMDIKRLKNINPSSVLDLGAGLGYYSRAFADEGLTVSYVDLDRYSLSFAKELNKTKKINIIEMDIESFLKTGNQTYDIIFFRHVIEHVQDPINILKLISNFMHDKSVLLLETDNNKSKELVLHPESKTYWQESYQLEFNITDLKELFKLQPFAVSTRETHWWGFDIDNLESLAAKADLKIIQKSEYHLGDKYFWPNITGFRQLLIKKRMTLSYLKYRLFNGPGAGLIFYISRE